MSSAPLEAIAHAPNETAQPNRESYFHDLDAARSILMILGIFLHAANIYTVDFQWLISDARSHVAFNYISATIHLFRMPAFFIISGFFCFWSLTRHGPGRLLARRLVRLVVPLLATIVLLNLAQEYWLAKRLDPTLTPGSFFQPSTFISWLGQGAFIAHVWFLVILVVYFLAVGALSTMGVFCRVVRALTDGALRIMPEALLRSGIWVFFLPFVSFAMLAVAKVLPELYRPLGTLSGFMFLDYLPFFALGMVMAYNPALFGAALRFRWWLLLVIGLSYWMISVPLRAPNGFLARLATDYWHYLLIWSLSLTVLALFHRLFARPSRVFGPLSDASYTIYLFHHGFVILFGAALLPLSIPLGLKYALIVVATFAVTLVIHFGAVTRIALLRFLFNGKIRT